MNYEKPKMEIMKLEIENVIRTSLEFEEGGVGDGSFRE